MYKLVDLTPKICPHVGRYKFFFKKNREYRGILLCGKTKKKLTEREII